MAEIEPEKLLKLIEDYLKVLPKEITSNSNEIENTQTLEIEKMIQSSDPKQKQSAIRAIHHHNDKNMIGYLVDCLQDKNLNVVQNAIDVIGDLGSTNKDVEKKLRELLNDGNKSIAISATISLAKLGVEEMAPLLLEILYSASDKYRRRGAARALFSLSTKKENNE